MLLMRPFLRLLMLFALVTTSLAQANVRTTNSVAIEPRWFVQDPLFYSQFDGMQLSAVIRSDTSYRSRDPNTRIEFEPYIRLDDRDAKRNYFDLREASITYRMGDWDVLAGVSQVFWGVNESRNVVDIINQFDTIEDIDEGEKLGQAMVRLSYRADWGVLEAYYLPYFREREFASVNGRLRIPFGVNQDKTQFERNGNNTAGDVALRYTKRFGNIDFGFHAFSGTNRTPLLIDASALDSISSLALDDETLSNNNIELVPFYQRLSQTGIDIQYTKGAWLWKFEGVLADSGGSYALGVGGFEYTFFDIKRTGWDLGIISEYLYDNRDGTTQAASIFDDDIFLGTRVTLNDIQDTSFLGGVVIDRQTNAVQGSLEFQRRIGNNQLLEIEGRFFNANDDVLVRAFDADDFVTLRYTYYF